jgi:hypothetical protein
MWYIYTMEYYSAIKKNVVMLCAGKWMELEDIMLSEVSQVQKDKGHVFSHMWKIDSTDKCTYKSKHDHIHTYIENMSVIVELFYGTQGRRERKREW